MDYSLNKPYENEVTLREQNICLKCYQPLELMLYFGKGLDLSKQSVCQRASELLAVKVGVFKKKSAASAITAKVCASASARVPIVLKV